MCLYLRYIFKFCFLVRSILSFRDSCMPEKDVCVCVCVLWQGGPFDKLRMASERKWWRKKLQFNSSLQPWTDFDLSHLVTRQGRKRKDWWVEVNPVHSPRGGFSRARSRTSAIFFSSHAGDSFRTQLTRHLTKSALAAWASRWSGGQVPQKQAFCKCVFPHQVRSRSRAINAVQDCDRAPSSVSVQRRRILWAEARSSSSLANPHSTWANSRIRKSGFLLQEAAEWSVLFGRVSGLFLFPRVLTLTWGKLTWGKSQFQLFLIVTVLLSLCASAQWPISPLFTHLIYYLLLVILIFFGVIL